MAKDKQKSIYRDTELGLGEFIESGGIPALTKKVGKHIGSELKGTKGARRTNKSGAYVTNANVTPAKQTGRVAARSKNKTKVTKDSPSSIPAPAPVKPVPSALEVSLSSTPSKVKATTPKPTNATWKRTVSTKKSPEVKGQISKKTSITMEPKTSVKSTLAQTSTPKTTSVQTTKKPLVTNYDRPSKKPTGVLTGITTILTKKSTARAPSEYEQIMTDIQPSRKKRK